MSALGTAIQGVSRALASFHPASMPRLSRAHYRRELLAWSLLPVAMGAVEGGLVGVIAKNEFAGTVSNETLNLTVGVLTAAPAFANILSFAWAAAAHGRHKIRALTVLQLATVVMVGLIALAPFSPLGLAVLVIGVFGARVCWSGVAVLRSTVWHANYPRAIRATMAGKLATVQAIVMAGVAAAIGAAVDFNGEAIRVVYPVAALVGGIGALAYSRMRMRGHQALLNLERAGSDDGAVSFNPVRWIAILHRDSKYRNYQTCMFVFGTGNLMVAPPLIIMMRDRFELAVTSQTLIAATIPLLLMPLSIPFWSRMLDRMHIIRFRAIHSWAFVSATSMVLIAAVLVQPILLFVAAVLKGIAFGGGVLGWNLGHHDFAPPERVSQYMGVHVTLTGIRGALAPIASVGIYQLLEWAWPDSGGWVFAVCLTLSVTGAIGFMVLSRRTSCPAAAESA